MHLRVKGKSTKQRFLSKEIEDFKQTATITTSPIIAFEG